MKVLNNLLFTIYLLVLLTSCKKTTSNRYDITEFGATADTTILSTVAINKAVETCSNNGGGTVYVPTGTYYSGTIILKSNVTLYLETGAVIKGSRDTADYMINGKKYGLVFARNAKNIAIEGHGELNGNGTYFFDPTKPHLAGDFDKSYTRQGENFMDVKYGLEDGPIKYITRPGMMVVIMNCENVKITDVMLRDTPEWTVRFGDCDNVDVRGVSIFANQLVPNSDGIHCTNSRNVRISDCDIRCGDDAVIVSGFDQLIGVHGEIRKAEDEGILLGNKTGRSENIMVTNCTLESRSAGIRIGYGEHSIRNCVFSNLSIYNSNRGIGIFARDTANIENLQFSNILIQTRLHKGHWWGKGEPVHISSIQQKKEYPVGYVKNIYFQNVRIE